MKDAIFGVIAAFAVVASVLVMVFAIIKIAVAVGLA
jgi:hypothetical protein